jgi:hypothetical protein
MRSTTTIAGGAEAAAGRPQEVTLTAEESAYLQRLYVTSNRGKGVGSMTAAARYAARTAGEDDANPLRTETAEAILAERASKHQLPTAVRRAMRGCGALVAEFRSPETIRLGGVYAPGTVRMTVDEETGEPRRVHAGERWVADDGSINFGVCVPWPWGGDACSNRYGVKVGRFQWLPVLDVRADMCVGWEYTMRAKESYTGADVVALLNHVAMEHGHVPGEMVLEGGAWQSARVLEWCRAGGVRVWDAKGRPHQKTVESWFNRAWTATSMRTGGQIGRFRGEMERESELMEKCRAGQLDPRRVFVSLQDAMSALAWCVHYLNTERSESDVYGNGVPEEDYAESLAAHPRPAYRAELGHLAWRTRERRKITRFGQVGVKTESPLGYPRPYIFHSEKLMAYAGAPVWVHFDAMRGPVRAVVTMAERWRDVPAGLVLDGAAPCVSSEYTLAWDEWEARLERMDGIEAAAGVKRRASLVVKRKLVACGLGGSRVAAASEVSAPAPAGLLGAGVVARVEGVGIAEGLPDTAGALEELTARLARSAEAETAMRERGDFAAAG